MNVKGLWGLLKETFSEWSEDKASRLAAALAYHTIFSLAPLLLIAIAIAGLVLSQSDVQAQVMQQIEGALGQQGAQQIQTMIENVSRPSAGILATIIGVITLLLGASGVFSALQDALNTIWDVQPEPGRGIMATIQNRAMTFLMVLGIGVLLLASLVITTLLSGATEAVGSIIGGSLLTQVLNFVISLAVITLLFALVFKILPDVEIGWGDVWLGAAVTALLFTIGRFLLGLYLARASVASPYGAAGSLVIILIWIYYSAQILFLGAEFTQVYARRYGTRIEPAAGAIRLTAEQRATQGLGLQKKGAEAASPRNLPEQPAVGAGVVGGHVARQAQQPAWWRKASGYGLLASGTVLGLFLGLLGQTSRKTE